MKTCLWILNPGNSFKTSVISFHAHHSRCENNYVSFCPFCKLMLNNRLPGTKRSRNCCNTAFCNRGTGIYNPWPVTSGLSGEKLLCIRAALSDRPLLHKLYIRIFPVLSVITATVSVTVKSPSLMLLIFPDTTKRHHDFLRNNFCFLDSTDYISCTTFI